MRLRRVRVLALDVGSTFVRAIVYDERGRPTGVEAKQRHAGLRDADELASVVEAIQQSVAREAGGVDAVAAACFWHSLLALDGRGRPLTQILGWRDADAADDAADLRRRLDARAVHGRTGCPLHPSYWPAKLAWLARTDPPTFRQAARFVSFAEYLYERALGTATMSVSMASGTGLLDVGRLAWDEELLAELELRPDRLPPLADEPLGEREPWFPALGDGACANLGVGCVTRERAALTVGTSAALRTSYAAERPRPREGLFLYRVDRRRVVEGGSLSDGGNLYFWLRETLQLPAVDELGVRAPAAHGLTFLPLLGGERAPGWSLRARGAVAGLTFDTSPEDLLQAALEGVAYRFAEVADLMPELEEVVATGGAMAENPAWVQIVADVLGRRVHVAAVPEASARGAAVYALEELGLEPDPAPLARAHEPRPEHADAHAAARDRQRRLYDALT